MKPSLYLIFAILFEIVGTSSLKVSEGFTKLLPTITTLVTYGVSFYFLSLTLKSIPIGIAYAIWSGVGIVLITLVGWVAFKQQIDLPAMIGIGLILSGVLVINIFSNSSIH